MTATWDPTRTAAVSTQCASSTEPAPSTEDADTAAVGCTTVAYRSTGSPRRRTRRARTA
ncbi:hypothetical protein [Streptomyces virginiae]|uniref:hypothetical protein n=1 Tax=Streptomyces virginiae TaxID=1961 RepID=UPI001FE3569F|nr:hypothetical protein [Streptomyces virginiae]